MDTNSTAAITQLLTQLFAPGRPTTETTSSSLTPDQSYALAQRMMGGVNGLASVQAQQRAGGMRGSSGAYFGTNNLLSNIAADVAARSATTTKTTTSNAPNLGIGGNLAGAYALTKFLDPNGDKLKGIGDWIFGNSGGAGSAMGTVGPSASSMGAGGLGLGANTDGAAGILSWISDALKTKGTSGGGQAGPGELLAAGGGSFGSTAGTGAGAGYSDPTAGGFFNNDPTAGAGASFSPTGVASFLANSQDLVNNYSEKNQAPALLSGIGGIIGGTPGMAIGKALGESGPGQDLSAGIYHTGQVIPEAGSKLQGGWDTVSTGLANSELSGNLNSLGSSLSSGVNNLGGGLNDVFGGASNAVEDVGHGLSNFGDQITSWLKW